jgi:hypothetical protein
MANFLELRQREVPRINLLGTSVNKLLVNVPNPSEWHHGWCPPSRETLVGKKEGSSCVVG